MNIYKLTTDNLITQQNICKQLIIIIAYSVAVTIFCTISDILTHLLSLRFQTMK